MKKQPDKIENNVKRKRPDVAAKQLLRKTHQETVVKSSLLNYLKGENEFKTAFISAIKNRVLSYSKRINMASLALADIIKKSYSQVEDVFDVVLPDIFEQTFIRQLMLGVESTTIKNGLSEYFIANPNYLRSDPRHYYDRNIYSAGAKKYITNLKNSLIFNLEIRIKQYTKKYQKNYDLPSEVRVAMLYRIYGWKMPQDILKTELTSEIIDECDFHRFILGLEEDEIIDPEKINLKNILNYYVYLNRFYESIDEKQFNIIPICSVKLHYITIDKLVLYGILTETKTVKCSREDFESLALDHYHSILHILKLQGKNNIFTGTIETDGIIMCTHFIKPKNTNNSSNEISILETDRVIAIDPGRVNIFYGVENKTNKIYKLTRRQYYKESGTDKAQHQSEIWQESIKQESILLSTVSIKGSNPIKHQEYMLTYLSIYDTLWTEYTKPRWSRQRFRLYGAKKRVFANFFNKIIKEDPKSKIIIAFGNAKFASGGKNEQSIPTSRAFKECASRFPCKLIDEFRTTRICYLDDSVLKKVAIKGAIEKKNWLRGLLWCGSTKNSKFINRDFNGAMNILRCALGPRPLALQRLPNQAKIIDRLGIIIKKCCRT